MKTYLFPMSGFLAVLSLAQIALAAPIANFQFSEGGGNYITDAQLNNTGTLSPLGGGRFTGGAGGKFGGALYLEHPTGKAWSGHTNFAQFDADFDLSSAGAVSFFINQNTIFERQVYVAGEAGNFEVEMRHSNEVFSVLGGQTNYTSAASSPPDQNDDGNWSHVVVNWGGGTHEVWVDGILASTVSSMAGPTTVSQAIRIGRRFTENSADIRPLDAGIDDLAFYSAPLNATARNTIASSGSASETNNLLVHWNLDNPVGTTLAGSNTGSNAINLHVGNPIGSGVTFDPGAGPVVNGTPLDALVFDGASELSRVIIPGSTSLDFDKTDGTIAMWVKLNADGQAQPLLKTTDESLEVQIRADGILYAAANDDNDSGNRFSSQQILAADGWTHIAFMWDQVTGTQEFYVNGIADTLATGGDTTWLIPNTADWVLGNDPAVPSRHFNGSLAGLYLYDYVLTSAEIELLAGIGPDVSSNLAVPEPSTFALAILSLCGFSLRRKRRLTTH